MASCDLSVDVLSKIVQQRGKQTKNILQFTQFNLAELAKWQICSKSMKLAIIRVLRQTKNLNIFYPPHNTDAAKVNGYLVNNAKLQHCVKFLVSEASSMSQIEFIPESENKSYYISLIRLLPYTAFMKRTFAISESWILTDIQASLKLKSQDQNCPDENEMCFITKPIIPSILTLRMKDPLTFKDRSYHARKGVKQLINSGCKSNCLQITVDSKVEGELLHTMIKFLQITNLKLNWKLGKCKHMHGWVSFLDYSGNNPLGQITSLKMNLTGSFHTKADIDNAFPHLKCAKFRRAECESIDQMIYWVKEYFVESVKVPTKIILQLKTPMAAYYDQPVEIDAEAHNIYRKIMTSVHNIATSHYSFKEAAVKIVLKSTNQKSAATIYLKTREYGNSPSKTTPVFEDFFVPFVNNDFISVREGDPFPIGAVKAMHRSLQTTDPSMIDSYVVHSLINGESTFGRAFNRNGKLHTVFSFCWKSYSGNNPAVHSLKMLVHRGMSACQNFTLQLLSLSLLIMYYPGFRS